MSEVVLQKLNLQEIESHIEAVIFNAKSKDLSAVLNLFYDKVSKPNPDNRGYIIIESS